MDGHVTLLQPNPNRVESRWFDAVLRSSWGQSFLETRCYSGSTNQVELSKSLLRSATVPVPSLAEQRRIAEILSIVDEAIRRTEQLVEKLKLAKRGLLHDLLTRGINDKGELRDPIRHPEQFKDSPLGLIPESWDTPLVDDVAIRGSGHTPSKSIPAYWNGGIKWVSLADSSKLDQVYISETDKQISSLGIANSSAVLHHAGTVILSRDAGIGKSAILATDMAVSQHFIAWKCGARLHFQYLYYWLQHNKPLFESIAFGSTIKTIGLSFFRRLKITAPPVGEQQQIAQILLTHEADIAGEIEVRDKLRALKQALMDDLLTGRVRVTPLLEKDSTP